jgi:uncharacterized Zn finger protein
VLSIDVDKGTVKARVQGSRPRPYDIHIEVKALSAGAWKKVAGALAGQALFAAKLLAGEMPQDIEKAFDDAGLSLFPEKLGDLKTECSCPDWSSPCKHIAAVYYPLGEEFDRDPFLLFKLCGLRREELVERLGAAAPSGDAAAGPSEAALPPEPLAADAVAFWQGGQVAVDFFGEVRGPPVAAALPRRLGNFPFWRGETPFLAALEGLYRQASPVGLDVLLGDR